MTTGQKEKEPNERNEDTERTRCFYFQGNRKKVSLQVHTVRMWICQKGGSEGFGEVQKDSEANFSNLSYWLISFFRLNTRRRYKLETKLRSENNLPNGCRIFTVKRDMRLVALPVIISHIEQQTETKFIQYEMIFKMDSISYLKTIFTSN